MSLRRVRIFATRGVLAGALVWLALVVLLRGFGTFHSPVAWACVTLATLSVVGLADGWRRRLGFLAGAMLAAAMCFAKAQYFLPFERQLPAATYRDVPLKELLTGLVRESAGRPSLRFVLCDTESLGRTATVSWPAGTRLSAALDQVATAAHLRYEKRWFSECGLTYPPTHASVCLCDRDGTMEGWLWEVRSFRGTGISNFEYGPEKPLPRD